MTPSGSMDNFTHIPFTTGNLDRYIVRNAILGAINKYMPQFEGRLLDMGCGKMPYKQYIFDNSSIAEYVGLDIATAINYDQNIKPDFTWDGIHMPFVDGCFDTVFATEVLEHCPLPDTTLNEVYRVLRAGGLFFFTTPFLWNLHETPHDEYRYTPFSLERHLRNAGFSEIEIRASGGWHASLAQMLGLWVKRAPLSPVVRKYLSIAFRPIMKKLLLMDAKSKIDFIKNPMITTIYGISRKRS